MKRIIEYLSTVIISITIFSCTSENSPASVSSNVNNTSKGGQEAVKDDESQKDVVKVAVASPDHKTLVAALQQAELVTSLANAGPFTVFAPTDAAFAKVDKATLDELMTDVKKVDLQNILQYHVAVAALKAETFRDGQSLGMVNGDNLRITLKDGKVWLNESAQIIGSVQASNGMVHVIDGVLLPPTK
jgi:uncharacterized surface protein with fasciclin (FAS1) repeats